MAQRCRAEIAEIHDTSLRWRPRQSVGYRKIADAYWDIYTWTNTPTNLQKTVKYLKIAIRFEPGNGLQHANLSIVYEHMGRIEDALRSCSEAIRLANDPETRLELEQRREQLLAGCSAEQQSLDLTTHPGEEGGLDRLQPSARPVSRERIEGLLQAGMRVEHTRDPDLRERALAEHGRVCMQCGLDPCAQYPAEVADDVLEVHHIVPVSEAGPRTTDAQDVWVLCSNCHKYLHALMRGGWDVQRLRDQTFARRRVFGSGGQT
jgi:predicted HNH restriction endonuclease